MGIVILTTALLLHEEEVLKAIVESVKETTIDWDKDLIWSAAGACCCQADVELQGKRRQQLLPRHQPQPGGSSQVLFVSVPLDPQLYRPLIHILQVGSYLLSKVF